MTYLIVGAGGHLGGEVARRALEQGHRVIGTYHSAPGEIPGVGWRPVDVRNRVAVRELCATVRPSVVINTAARYGDWATTADGAASVALAAADVGARLVHLSTDALHGGRPEPYGDDEVPSPITPYGASKAAAETAVRALHPGAALVRTSLIIGDERSAQVRLCIDMITGRTSGVLFADEFRCPIGVADLAGAVLETAVTGHAGVLNVAGPDAVSRAELGELVARHFGLDPMRVPVGTIAAAGLHRPGRVVLDSSRAAKLLTTRIRGVRELLDHRPE
ncbi:dTDP-4-dehydrorhamnose reductase [Catenuloplanes nepalensis]|uniref:dTDP-4-dehydrorhamnose reductase n=1 Tax=Catenuloplanes nepalensis TaxID=587533 RepID=A0ABT9MYY9_9ACTN|nr:sugar nucleotide-binding protein [Catenuloplanes nepalensis]MDP9796251.1 dTDP-4-dehydrorhamnose reductase [Catenuloplanes nepalensis]